MASCSPRTTPPLLPSRCVCARGISSRVSLLLSNRGAARDTFVPATASGRFSTTTGRRGVELKQGPSGQGSDRGMPRGLLAGRDGQKTKVS